MQARRCSALPTGSGAQRTTARFDGDRALPRCRGNGRGAAHRMRHGRLRALLVGDAWAQVLVPSLTTLLGHGDRRQRLDLFKIPHHGSVANISEELLARLSCKHYLISTSGARFRHPHPRTVDLLLDRHNNAARPRLHFNYFTSTTEAWSDDADQQARGYQAFHPRGISLEL